MLNWRSSPAVLGIPIVLRIHAYPNYTSWSSLWCCFESGIVYFASSPGAGCVSVLPMCGRQWSMVRIPGVMMCADMTLRNWDQKARAFIPAAPNGNFRAELSAPSRKRMAACMVRFLYVTLFLPFRFLGIRKLLSMLSLLLTSCSVGVWI